MLYFLLATQGICQSSCLNILAQLSSAQLFAGLTAKFNFYCCLTLLNDFYCLLSFCRMDEEAKAKKPL